MAHKTFISYKYSEAQDLRDAIIDAMGDDASYYQGETSESPDLTDTSTENIKKHLRDMMFDTSVTIVLITPHMKESKWTDSGNSGYAGEERILHGYPRPGGCRQRGPQRLQPGAAVRAHSNLCGPGHPGGQGRNHRRAFGHIAEIDEIGPDIRVMRFFARRLRFRHIRSPGCKRWRLL